VDIGLPKELGGAEGLQSESNGDVEGQDIPESKSKRYPFDEVKSLSRRNQA
jgi:hypothetical protein